MNFLSVCSGIEAASVAWAPLGWRAVLVSEIADFPRRVLAHRQGAWDARRERGIGHNGGPALWGDFTTIRPRHLRRLGICNAIDLLVGGTPCQSFSVAGLRGGLDDARGNLALEYLRLARRLRPRWLVWENVPGVLSSNGGRDFGAILGGMVQLGYGVAYRVLDAQYTGVPQRRRRVFVVGYLGDWRAAAAVLFERHSLQGHSAPGVEARQGVSGTLAGGARGRGGYSADDVPMTAAITAATLDASFGRLQGFPDGYTRVPMRKVKAPRITAKRPADMWECINGQWWRMAADGPRYKALGNSMAIPPMRWIGERIAAVEAMKVNREAAE